MNRKSLSCSSQHTTYVPLALGLGDGFLCMMWSSERCGWERPNPQARWKPITLFSFKYPMLSPDKNTNYSVNSGGSGWLSKTLSWSIRCGVEIAECPASGPPEGQCCFHLDLWNLNSTPNHLSGQMYRTETSGSSCSKMISYLVWGLTEQCMGNYYRLIKT